MVNDSTSSTGLSSFLKKWIINCWLRRNPNNQVTPYHLKGQSIPRIVKMSGLGFQIIYSKNINEKVIIEIAN